MTKYNHAFTIAFSLEDSHSPTGEDCTADMLINAMSERVDYLRSHPDEIIESCGMPFDTYIVERSREISPEKKDVIGTELAEILQLKIASGGNIPPRYSTTWGTKTAIGLYETISRILKEGVKK